MTKPNLKIEQLNPEKLVPYSNNARTHTAEQIGQIAGSIAEFGFVNPILVGEDDVIIAGHGRLLAAQKLGLEHVPVIRLDHLSKEQRQALVIADNKIAENAGWDENLLRLELKALEEADFDLEMIGFNESELDELFANLDEDNSEAENDVPENAKAFSETSLRASPKGWSRATAMATFIRTSRALSAKQNPRWRVVFNRWRGRAKRPP